MKHNKNTLFITIAAVIIAISILALGASLYINLTSIRNIWSDYNHASTKASKQLNHIHSQFGYGGTIHKFKNYVLRQKAEDFNVLQRSFSLLNQSLENYRQFTSTSEERSAIDTIKTVVNEYESKVFVAQQLITMGATPSAIDTKVKVDDKPALIALTTLNNAAEMRTAEIEKRTNQAFATISNHLLLGLIIIPALIYFAYNLVSVLRKLTRSNIQLTQANQAMDDLFEAVPDAILTCNKSGKVVNFNREALNLFGYNESELASLTIEDLMPERFRKTHDKFRKNYFDRPAPRMMENSGTLSIKTRTGEEIPVEIKLSHLKDTDGLKAIAAVRDISVRKAQEAAIKVGQAQLAEAQRIAKLGSWSYDFDSHTTYWSDELYNILKLNKGSLVPSLDHYLSLSTEPNNNELADILSADNHNPEQSRYLIIREIQRLDGKLLHVHEEGEIVRDSRGKPIKALGTIRDITESVQTREKLEQAAVVFEHTSDAVMITDKHRKIIAVNKAFLDITGYSEHEILGQDAGFGKSGKHSDDFYTNMELRLKNEGYWEGEIWDRRKDGTIYPKRLSINSVKNSQGKLLYYVGVFSDISHIKETEEQLRYLALHDSLTGLPNRLSFNEKLDHAIKHARRTKTCMAVLFLDLDRFKNINDSLGHPVGDALLIEVAKRLSDTLREDDTIARLGGDEFTVVLEEINSPEDVVKVSEKIVRSLSVPVDIDNHQFHISTSIGVSLYPKDGSNVTELVKNADSAMYVAKESGRSCYKFYSHELAASAVAKLELESELRQAIKNQEFTLYYQPQFNIATNELIGAEALIRWKHPKYGMVAPDKFIPLAEETGLIMELGEFALNESCQKLSEWHKQGFMLPKVSVNVAGKQILSKEIIPQLKNALSLSGVTSTCLEIELTETTLMQQTDQTISTLKVLRALGVTISIDDFGTGYSSLSYLKSLPIHKIKIDRSFVQDIPDDLNDVAITKAIIGLSKTLQLEVIAEGLETTEQLSFLLEEQCTLAQGYLFCKPLPACQFYKEYFQNAQHPTSEAPVSTHQATSQKKAQITLN